MAINGIATNGSSTEPERVFVFEAADEAAAKALIEKYAAYLDSNPSIDAGDLAYTLEQRCSYKQPYRFAVVATDAKDLATKLRAEGETAVTPKALSAADGAGNPKIAFVSNGQGSLWFGMARELFHSYPVFAKVLQTADEQMKLLGGEFSLIDELFNDAREGESRLEQPEIAQPSTTAIQCGLIELVASWGIEPSVVIGHSSGEIAAGYAAGELTLKDALVIAYHRGQAVVELETAFPELRGTLMAVAAPADKIELFFAAIKPKYPNGVLCLAAESSPYISTVAGRFDEIDTLAEALKAKEVWHRKLGHKIAYHSPDMEAVAPFYTSALERVGPFTKPTTRTTKNVEFFSSRYGKRSEIPGISYWVDTLTQPVKFLPAFMDLCKETQPDVLIEFGAHATLQVPIKHCIKALGMDEKVQYFPTLVRDHSANATCLKVAAGLFELGHDVKLGEVNRPGAAAAGQQVKVVEGLPAY